MVKRYDICMIGLGPVGAVSGLCFARQGFRVIGVDINPRRVAAFTHNTAPFVEPGVDDLIAQTRVAGTFCATVDFATAVQNSSVIMVAVGTPTPVYSGRPDLSALDKVAESLGKALRDREENGCIIVLRSTVPPGTIRHRFGPIIEKHSGFKAGREFQLASNPEFLREGMAISDFFNTGRVVIGTDSEETASALASLYHGVSGEVIFTSIESAEFAKYADNSWHALKVAFANEIGRVVAAFGGNVEETARLFLMDDKLNISAKYLTPGFAFGGSCLPKDVRGLNWLAAEYGVNLPVMAAILPSNEEQIHQGVQAVLATGARKAGLLGLAFKPGVDDLRESPALAVAEQLQERGLEVLAHDACLPEGMLAPIPLLPLEEVVAQADLLVKFHDLPIYEGFETLDLTGVVPVTKSASRSPAARNQATSG